jgi:hypothetical protein
MARHLAGGIKIRDSKARVSILSTSGGSIDAGKIVVGGNIELFTHTGGIRSAWTI